MDSPVDIGYHKSSFLVDLNDLGLLARKSLNACFYLASLEPGKFRFKHDIKYFCWLSSYNSNDYSGLLERLREAQKSTIVVSLVDPDRPADFKARSVTLLTDVAIADGYIHFEVNQNIKHLIDKPDSLNFLSLRIQGAFDSVYSLRLYEFLLGYIDSGQTDWLSLDLLRQKLCSDGIKIANEFKTFKQRIIQPAVKELISVTGWEACYELKKTGRFYSHIRFTIKVTNTVLNRFGLTNTKIIYESLVGDIGLSDAELSEVSAASDDWGLERLSLLIDFVKDQIATRPGEIKYPNRLFMKLFRDGHRLSDSQKTLLKSKKAKEKDKAAARDQIGQKKRSAPKTKITLPEGEELARLWELFKLSPSAKLFKQLPGMYQDADTRAKAAFEGFMRNQSS